jgi:5-methyltetrahydrofolate--homocysteine methyltransferase
MSSLLDLLSKRCLVFDGAMGTMLAARGATAACNEELCVSHPEIVAEVHRAYLDAGCDILTTNTFGASRVMLTEHGLADRVREINGAAVAIARAEVLKVRGRSCFVAGEVGPTSKVPTLGAIAFEELAAAYEEQIEALTDGGVDLLIIDTCQDPLQTKAAAAAAGAVAKHRHIELPVVISVTVEARGTMLLGTEVMAALAALAPYTPLAFGLNCATGPMAMEEHLAALADGSPFLISCRPNAGLPELHDGRLVYPMDPHAFGKTLASFVKRFGLALVGGCCGTTPTHIEALVRELQRVRPATPATPARTESVSSLFTATSLDQEPRPFLVAEQTNVNGSKAFRDLLLAENYEGMADAGRKAAAGSHALDLCVAYAGRNEVRDLAEVAARLALKADIPLMLDSTNLAALSAGLERTPGRSIINSINLEDGGTKARAVLALARRYGAAIVGLTIDERGMARTAGEKLRIAQRLVALVKEEGLREEDLLIDPLTFTLASGDPELRSAGRETLEALRAIGTTFPRVRTVLGVSNISFGLHAKGRAPLTSVFLHEALEAGLHAAIVNPARIMPLDAIPEKLCRLCHALIADDTSEGNPLTQLLTALESAQGGVAARRTVAADAPAEERLRGRVIEGSREDLPELVNELMAKMSPRAVIMDVLLPAMREVGVRFSAGRMPLPFVLGSAETMRAAINMVTPHLGGDSASRGTIVLATVRGDVHDIGKNLVEAILGGNGFRVINLGIRQTAESVITAARAEKADAVGLSGLLVSSCEVMREDLELFQEAGLALPVFVGGAALTERFTQDVLAPVYGGRVVYCADAFDGLTAMQACVRM